MPIPVRSPDLEDFFASLRTRTKVLVLVLFVGLVIFALVLRSKADW